MTSTNVSEVLRINVRATDHYSSFKGFSVSGHPVPREVSSRQSVLLYFNPMNETKWVRVESDACEIGMEHTMYDFITAELLGTRVTCHTHVADEASTAAFAVVQLPPDTAKLVVLQHI